MKDIHSGCAAALLITGALSATISCGDVDSKYGAIERNTASGGNAGKASTNSAGARAGATGTGGFATVTVGGQSASGGFSPGSGGSAAGTGDPSLGTAGFSPGPIPPAGMAGSSPGAAGSSPGAGGSSPGTAGSSPGTGGSPPTMCTGQNHLCLGNCVSNASVDHCGGSCDPCQAPSGATATCDGSQCGFSCGSMKKCGSKCIPSDGCCSDNDCPAQNGMSRQCDTSSNTCKTSGCASGFKPCGNACIANNACCSNNDCSGTCQTCSGGTCVSVKNADDIDSCAGTCDSNGSCKSKRRQACNTVAAGCIGDSPCVDGYCCDSACSGQCQACDVKDKQGICSTVPSGAPHSKRDKCADDGKGCGGSCSGKSGFACDYPTMSCGDAKCDSSSTFIAKGTCNAGTCSIPAATTCKGNLICSDKDKACKGQCDSDSDCVTNYVCSSHACQPKQTGIDFQYDAALSGMATSDNKSSSSIQIGDDEKDHQICGFVSFKISKIPKGATLVFATLEFEVTSMTGTPYKNQKLGPQQAQKVKYNTFDASVFKLTSTKSAEVPDSVPVSTHLVTVDSLVQEDVDAGGANTQFRLCFQTPSDGDKSADFVKVAPPILHVKYYQK